MKGLFLFVLIVCSLSLQGQVHFTKALVEASMEEAKARPIENVYLRTSKEVYETSEDLWFSARVLHGQLHSLSSLSETLYLELRSAEEGGSVYRELFKLENGLSQGHFFLPDSLKTGEYRLTAFTANSVKHANEALESVRRIMVRKKIVPHVLMQTTFEQDFFEAGQPVKGELRLLTPGGDRIVDAKVIMSLLYKGKRLDRARLRSDTTGRVSFELETQRNPADLRLTIKVDYEDHEEYFEQPVPYNIEGSVQLQFLPEGGKLLAGMSGKVAFKAVDRSGMPFDIQNAMLFANGEKLLDFSSEHAGMGSFAFFANPDVHYTVQINEPQVDSIYVLPAIQQEGLRLQLQRDLPASLVVGITKTAGLSVDSVHLAVKQRGMLTWAASSKMGEGGKLVRIPKADLLTGMAELMLFDDKHQAVSSRLVFIGHNRQLKVKAELDHEKYGVKELATLRLKVTDQFDEPVQALLSLAATDELYSAAFAEKNIMSHYLLESELKGNVFNPAYYFDQSQPKRKAHLDLLLLTQGWRDYEWRSAVLQENMESDTLPMVDYVLVQIDPNTLPAKLKKRPEIEVQVVSGVGGVLQLKSDSLGRFPLVPQFLAMSEGTDAIINIAASDRARVSFTTAFDHLNDQLSHQHMEYGLSEKRVQNKNWDKLPQFNAPAQEVMGVVVTNSKPSYGKLNGASGHYTGNNTDYVCNYDILNCRNHRFGRKPNPGQMYRMGSRWVIYEAPGPAFYANKFKGYYKSPKFYEPEYDKKPEEKLIPDFRNTLVWQPQLYTDENGEVTVTFFTSDIRSIFNGWIEGMGANGHFGLGKFEVKVLK